MAVKVSGVREGGNSKKHCRQWLSGFCIEQKIYETLTKVIVLLHILPCSVWYGQRKHGVSDIVRNRVNDKIETLVNP